MKIEIDLQTSMSWISVDPWTIDGNWQPALGELVVKNQLMEAGLSSRFSIDDKGVFWFSHRIGDLKFSKILDLEEIGQQAQRKFSEAVQKLFDLKKMIAALK